MRAHFFGGAGIVPLVTTWWMFLEFINSLGEGRRGYVLGEESRFVL